MEQLKKMDGIIITYPKSTKDSTKIPPQAFVEGRPKRQRPTHAGKGGCGSQVNYPDIFTINTHIKNQQMLFTFSGGAVLKDEGPYSTPETAGTLQWGCSNCRDYDR